MKGKCLDCETPTKGRGTRCYKCRNHQRRVKWNSDFFPDSIITQWERQFTKKYGDLKDDFSVSFLEDQWNSQQGECWFSGVQLVCDNPKLKDVNTCSIDRLDSSKGYDRDNVVFVHKRVNMMKGSLTVEEFIEWCKLIRER